jgi:hypothetical protein
MAFQFRFPIATFHLYKTSPETAVEKAREYALPLPGERKKRPSLTETDEWISELLEAEKTTYEETYA